MRTNGYSVTAGRYIRRSRITRQIREWSEATGIRIIRAKVGDHGKIGIHLLEAEQFELDAALEKAERDLYPAIYLHTFKTWMTREPARKKYPALRLV